jgi:hypothetical protein
VGLEIKQLIRGRGWIRKQRLGKWGKQHTIIPISVVGM